MQPWGGGGHIRTVTSPLKKRMVDHLQRTAEEYLLDRFYVCQPRPPLHKRYSHEPAELGVYAMGFRWSSSISRTTCHDGGYSCLLLDSHVPLPPIAHPQVLCPRCTVLMYAFLSVKRANANWTPSLNLQRLRLRSPSSARPAFVAAFGVRWRRTRLLPTKMSSKSTCTHLLTASRTIIERALSVLYAQGKQTNLQRIKRSTCSFYLSAKMRAKGCPWYSIGTCHALQSYMTWSDLLNRVLGLHAPERNLAYNPYQRIR